MNKTEERDILDSVEQGEWRSVDDLDETRSKYQSYAQATRIKDHRINIRVSKKDLDALQALALEEGLPYQTLISSVLHKYVSGRLIDRPRQPGSTES